MRGEHIVAVQQAKQLVRIMTKHAQGIGIDNKRSARSSKGHDIGMGRRPNSGRRPDHHYIGAQGCGFQFRIRIKPGQHDGFEMGGIDGQGIGRRQDRDQTGADSQTGPRCQPCRARIPGLAGNDHHAAARMFVG